MDKPFSTARPVRLALGLLGASVLIVALFATAASAAPKRHVFKAKATSEHAAYFVVKGISARRVLAARFSTGNHRKHLKRKAVRNAVRKHGIRITLPTRHRHPVVAAISSYEAAHGEGGESSGGSGRSKKRKEPPKLEIIVAPPTTPTPPTTTPTPPSSTQPGSCTLQSVPEGTDPGACWRPFSAASPFNQTLPASPKVSPNSSAIVEGMFRNAQGNGPTELEVFNDGRGGEPTYFSKQSDPVFTIHCTESWGRCDVEGMKVHIPAGAETEGNVASVENGSQDAHLTVIDPSTETEYDFWQVETDPIPASGGTLNISWGGYTSLSGTGLDMPTEATAAKWASLEGRIRAEEVLAGQIDHAIFINVPCDNGTWVYPAYKAGSRCSNTTNSPPMGTRLQLNYSVAEIEAMAVPSWKKTVLRAMSEYGMFIGDTGSPGLFSLERETGNQYTTMGQVNKWLELVSKGGFSFWNGEGGVNVGNLSTGVDWHRLRVIEPCVSEGKC